METSTNVLQYYIPCEEKSHDWPQVFGIFVLSLGAFTCGVQFVWTSPSITILTSNISHIDPISLTQASYLVTIPPVIMVLISPFIGLLLDSIGRKKTVFLMPIPHFFSWLLIILAENIYLIYISRFLSGIGYAFYFNALPVYVGEISTPKVRGLWGNLITVSTFFGQLMVNIIGTYYDIKTTAIIFCWVPLVQLILIWWLQESPYFFIIKNKEREARKVLKKLRGMKNVDEELVMIKKDVQRQLTEQGTIKEMFTIKTNRKALIICSVIQAAQQFSGLTAFAVYTQYMFKEAGGNFSASASAIIYSAVWTVAICFSSLLAGNFGRKPLLIFSCVACSIILSIEATYFCIKAESSIDISKLNWLPLAGMIFYIVVCSAGLGVIPVLLLGEMFSTRIKGKALSFINICFGIYMVVVPEIFQIFTDHFGLYIPFYLFSLCCFGSSLFCYYCLFETKGKTLEEIQQILRSS